MGRQQERVYHVEREEFPRDFPARLEAFVEAAGLSWRGLARRLKVNVRVVRRWKAGAKPGSGHLVNLAAGMGLLHILLPSVAEPQAVKKSGRRGALLTGDGEPSRPTGRAHTRTGCRHAT